MRLLEFSNYHGSANPQAVVKGQQTAKSPVKKAANPKRARAGNKQPGQVFPINGSNAVTRPAHKNPIDLEQLQQRIEVLERRMRERARNNGARLPVKELEQLKRRMKLLERSVHNELWAAKQREHTLLEMLARPPLKTVLRNRVKRYSSQTLPAAGRWLADVGRAWWHAHQPLWWPRFARAWQESLDAARGVPPSRINH
jgi:hypothetical protein